MSSVILVASLLGTFGPLRGGENVNPLLLGLHFYGFYGESWFNTLFVGLLPNMVHHYLWIHPNLNAYTNLSYNLLFR